MSLFNYNCTHWNLEYSYLALIRQARLSVLLIVPFCVIAKQLTLWSFIKSDLPRQGDLPSISTPSLHAVIEKLKKQQAVGKTEKRKKGSYNVFDADARLASGQYAVENGTAAAIRKFTKYFGKKYQ